MKQKSATRLSYTCNGDKSTKHPDKKWRKIKHKYVNRKVFDFEGRTKNLLDVKSVLDELKVPFFLTHGALLGAYREGDFIKYDGDIDLDVFDEIFILNYDKICKKLIEKGFIVRGRDIKRKGKKGEKIHLFRDKEQIEIRGIYLDSNYEQNKYRLTSVFQYLRKFHDNPDTITFKGVTFMTPGPIEEFLVYCFGKSWRTPVFKTKKEKAKGYKRGVRRPGR